MGIRFLCSNCEHRLNVKTKQAGQFCICPDCESEIQIPLESTISPIKKKRESKRRRGKHAPVEVELTPVISEQHSIELPSRPEVTSPAEANLAEQELGFPVEVRAPAAQAEPSSYVEQKTIEETELFISPKKIEKPVAKLVAKAEPVAKQATPPAESHVDREPEASVTNSKMNDSASVPADFLAGDSDSSSHEFDDTDSFLLAKPTVKIENDPLKSDPNLVWYLRHKRLGEKGPLKSGQIEAMLESGQLRVGYIVWREDWNDWIPVEKVFPQLEVKPAESTYQIPDELNPHSEVSRKRRSQKRFWMCFNAVAFLILILLVYWVTHFGW